MAWQTLPGLSGKVYIPERCDLTSKHPCADCFACQHCGEDRCGLCRQAKTPPGRCGPIDRG